MNRACIGLRKLGEGEPQLGGQLPTIHLRFIRGDLAALVLPWLD